MILKLTKITHNKKIQQISMMYSGLALSTILGIANSVLTARVLGPELFGDFRYVTNIFMLLSSLLQAGVYVTGSRLLAIEKNYEIKKQITSGLIAISIILSVILTLCSMIFGLIQKSFEQSELSLYFFWFAPLLFGYQFKTMFENKYIGENKIRNLSFFQFIPQLFFQVVFLLLTYIIIPNANTALAVQLSGFIIIALVFIFFEKKNLELNKVKVGIKYLLHENKKYGLQVYIGSVLSVSSQYLAGFFLSLYNTNNVNVGFYTLAVTISAPLTIIASSIGSVYYKQFATQLKIPSKIIGYSATLAVIVFIVYFLLIDKIVYLFYSTDYAHVGSIARLLAIGTIIHGFGDIFNRFLGSKGHGKSLRNASIFTGIVVICGNIWLVKWLDIKGALITRLLSDFTYFISIYIYYKLFIKNVKTID
ncbi:MAG: oligosaccharide flippase family protein [Bacteroidales bacterium]|nr:oligosaccharide flippase family protein [Bacteroidales bacterium]